MSIEFQIIHPYDHEKKIFGEMVRSSIKKPVNPYDGTHQFEYEYKRKIWDERIASLPRFKHEIIGKKAGDIVHEGKDFKFNAMVCGVTCSPNGVYCNNYCNADKTKKMPEKPMLYAVPIIQLNNFQSIQTETSEAVKKQVRDSMGEQERIGATMNKTEYIIKQSVEIAQQPMFTKEQVLEAIRAQYVEDFGQLQNDDIERDGYFILGFVTKALNKLINSPN